MELQEKLDYIDNVEAASIITPARGSKVAPASKQFSLLIAIVLGLLATPAFAQQAPPAAQPTPTVAGFVRNAFNGSRNFAPGTLVEFFQRMGMSFGGEAE